MSTQALMKLLEESGAVAQLSSFAAEKVAEELTRKLEGGKVTDRIIRDFERRVEEVGNRAAHNFQSKWSFPHVAHAVVQEVTKEYLAKASKPVVEKIAAEVQKVVTQQEQQAKARINEHARSLVTQIMNDLDAQIEATARKHFISVMTEVREATR